MRNNNWISLFSPPPSKVMKMTLCGSAEMCGCGTGRIERGGGGGGVISRASVGSELALIKPSISIMALNEL